MTGIAKGHVSRTLKELEVRCIITRKGKVTAFNKLYDEWRETGKGARRYKKLPDEVTKEKLPDEVTKVTQRGNKKLPDEGNSKENSKETSKRKSKYNVPDSEKPNPGRFDPEDMRLAKLLETLMNENNPSRKQESEAQLRKWADCCRLMRERDDRNAEGIEGIIRFSQNDDFWKQNILSMDKLRIQYDRLTLKMEGKENGSNRKNPLVFINE
jgi:hypothetical protein